MINWIFLEIFVDEINPKNIFGGQFHENLSFGTKSSGKRGLFITKTQ